VINWCDDNTDDDSHLMHNKFIVIKNKSVLTGSYNFTDNSTEWDDNNIVIINSSEAAKCYEAEFLYMYENKKFGPYKNTINPPWNGKEITISPSCKIKIYFSPYTSPETVSNAIIRTLRNIKENLYFAVYTLTGNTGIDEEIMNLKSRGVEICGITELERVSQVYYFLRERGVRILVDGNRGYMHHKFAISDVGLESSVVITGSYNWTLSADSYNDENVLFIYSTEIGKKFYEEFLSLYKNAVEDIDTTVVKSAASDIMEFVIYPSPAVNANYVNFGFKVSSRVKEVKINIYTLSGIKVKEIPIENFCAHFYNEYTYYFDKGIFLVPDVYFVTLESVAHDGCRSIRIKKLLITR
jgi:phosphatidylserine/phosphatidylglycerophosphate/cardiolipin synthase-like enzyme